MGSTLSSPATDKKTEGDSNGRYAYAVSEMQGWRISMEDAHTTRLNLDETEGDKYNSFFAVYDGHGGHTVAKYAGENVYKRLLREDAYREGKYEEALKATFIGIDEDLRADPAHERDPSGCTAVAALLTPDRKIFLANAGDSRSVISIKGEVKPLSYDHKPQNEVEVKRIQEAGGYVEFGRVNGNLALARALGDFEFKKNLSLPAQKQIITADPDVIEHQMTDEDEFLILACDGIWDCLTSQQVVNIVRLKISEGMPLGEICEFICEHCLAPDTNSGAGIGCDNMTMMIVAILNGRTQEEWQAWITDRVKNHYGYETPTCIQPIYAPSRVAAFRQRQADYQDRLKAMEKEKDDRRGQPQRSYNVAGFPGLRLISQWGAADFSSLTGDTDSADANMEDDSESGDDMEVTDAGSILGALGGKALGLGEDVTNSLRAQLAELEDDDPDTEMGDGEEHASAPGQGEAPPPPKPTENGEARQEQLSSTPGGDEASPAVKAEGLLDKSEDPSK